MTGVQSITDIPYANYGDRELVLDVHRPEHFTGKLPVILIVAGGAWRSGRKDSTPVRYAKRGFAMVGICYRGSAEVKAPGNVHDCKAAIRWIRANAEKYGFDTENIGAFGTSAGGHLVALLGSTPGVAELEGEGGNPGFSTKLHAICDVCGPCDLTKLPEYRAEYPSLDEATSEYLGGPVEEHMELARLVSPLFYVSKDTPVTFLMHGDIDTSVPLQESYTYHDALKKAGVEVSLRVLPGIGHGDIDWDVEDENIQSFFERTLKKA
ncbi:MAG: alpha/beta hydrolase [Chthoniobacterales bacterium]